MAYTIRRPRISDFDQINTLGKWFQENSFYSHCGWSDGKCFAWLVSGTDPESSTFIRVVDKDDEVIGFFLGTITEYFFSHKKIAQDLVMVFDPEERVGIVKPIITLVREFTAWAESKNANEVCIGITSGIAGKGYESLILRSGFKQVGNIMKRKV